MQYGKINKREGRCPRRTQLYGLKYLALAREAEIDSELERELELKLRKLIDDRNRKLEVRL